jgi:taurine dioxygenase
MEINRLCLALGGEIRGLDVAQPLSDETFARVHQAWLEHDGVLVIRDQRLTPQQHIDFSRRFGELFGDTEPLQDTVSKYLLPGHPQIYRVSNKTIDGVPQGRMRAGNYWHSDVSFRQRPAQASLLYALEIPPLGGDTLFCNMYLAYERLSETLQQFLSTLQARHDFAVNTTRGFAHETIEQQDLGDRNASIHPVVRRHPQTGRQALYVNPGNTSHILGLHPEESAHLLSYLYQHCIRAEHVYRHRWEPHDLLIWDNRCTMHYAIVDYEGLGNRYMHRTTVIGEKPV